jgi:serine phosphatase RsbU (regulator of sigma subunit)
MSAPVDLQPGGNGEPVASGARGPESARLAAFTLDSKGCVTCWPAAAAELFGLAADTVTGRDLREFLPADPGQQELADRVLAAVAAGQPWTGTLALAVPGGGPATVRCDPLAGPGTGSLVTVQNASPQPGPGWLSQAAARIGSTLDLTRTAREVADVAVPGFADGVSIFVPERLLAAGETARFPAGGATAVRRLAARLAGQSLEVTNGLLPPGEAIVVGADSPAFQAMAAAGPVTYDRLAAETEQRIARHPDGRELAAGYTSFLAMPLIARGAVVGCATFGRVSGRRAFGPADITVAGELASRAAVCLDNARLYERERRTAEALQRGLLPARPKVPAGLQVAHRYLPVGDSVVGGDWHDVIPLPGGRAALIVGDAMGHGPEAAAVMVQLRTAAHTLADLDLPPGEILGRLDKMAAGLAAAPFAATCICAIIDAAASSCEIAQAGHHPPVLVLAGGATQVLSLPPGLPLGLDAEASAAFQATRVSLPPGATLALYTDGLVESRTRPLDQGMAALRDALGYALARPGATLGSTCATVTHALRQHGEDDITLVLARIRQPG